MDREPKISVITACFNHGRYVNEMLNSLFQQNFEDFEVVIVNDGSTDDTAEILNKINDPRIKIIHTENHGPAFARNTAIIHSGAEIILNLDADDKIGPGFLQSAYDIFSSGCNAGIVYSEVVYFGAASCNFEPGDFTREAMLIENRITSIALFRKEDWKILGGYSDELIWGLEDWDLWLGIIGLGRKVVKTKGPLAFYRTYDNKAQSRSGKRKTDKNKADQSLVIIFNRHKKLYSEYPAVYKRFLRFEKKVKIKKFLDRILMNPFRH
jgi:glycosyltransferase involved in cell wall biosynthesis